MPNRKYIKLLLGMDTSLRWYDRKKGSMTNKPIDKFKTWLEEAKNHAGITEPTAMSLATATQKGIPSVRMVLLKGLDERGFVFYTNLESRKSAELIANPHAALCFYWMPLKRCCGLRQRCRFFCCRCCFYALPQRGRRRVRQARLPQLRRGGRGSARPRGRRRSAS
jgi:hypothetical protein